MTVLKAFILTLLLIFVFSLTQVGFVFIFYETKLVPESFQNHIGITITISFVIAYLIMFKYFLNPKPNIEEILSLKKSDYKILPYLIVIVFGLQLLNRPFWDLEKIWNYLNYSEFENDFRTFDGFNQSFLYYLISTLIVSPICEELFFRKLLLKKLMEHNSKKIGIIISSLCFAIIHFEIPFNLIPTFVFGIISSLIFIKTKKIRYSILLHFLANFFVQILYVFNFPFDNWLLDLNFNFIYWILFLIGIVITYFGIKKLLTRIGMNNAIFDD